MGKTAIMITGFLMLVATGAAAAGAVRPRIGAPLRALGIETMECNCSQTESDDGRTTQWIFQTEPTIQKVSPDGPAQGRLKRGDSIVAIDGQLITTREGGMRFSRIAPGEPVVLTVRRGARTREETIVPALGDDETPVIVGLDDVTRAGELRRLSESVEALSRLSMERQAAIERQSDALRRIAGRLPRSRDKLVIPLETLERLADLEVLRDLGDPGALRDLADLERLDDIDDVAPSGSFGFALSFAGSIRTGDGKEPAWRFDAPPEIHSVDEGGPAESAGLLPGDVLTEIDGVVLDTDEGGRRFSDVRPGQRVRWTIRRDGKERTVEAVAVERAPRADADGRTLRYSGSLGDTDIEVTGDRRIRVVEDGDVITIRTRDATIRLRRSEQR